jgi:hypothetical protein
MRKNQKYTQEDMYHAIGQLKESGQSHSEYCSQNKMSYHTFKYWLKKYKKGENYPTPQLPGTFIPLQAVGPKAAGIPTSLTGEIIITYPTGVQVICPPSVGVGQLKALINL